MHSSTPRAETSSTHLEQLGTGCTDLGLGGETQPFTGPSVSPLGASAAQPGELAVVAKAARHEVVMNEVLLEEFDLFLQASNRSEQFIGRVVLDRA